MGGNNAIFGYIIQILTKLINIYSFHIRGI